MVLMNEARVKNELLIHIDGKTLQPPKNILTKDELLEMVDLDPKRNEIVLITKQGEAHPIDSAEGLELQDGMEFRVRQDGS